MEHVGTGAKARAVEKLARHSKRKGCLSGKVSAVDRIRADSLPTRASFAPACLSHEIIIRSYWTDIQVKGTSLPRALHCWDRSFHDSHKASKTPMKGCPFHLVDSCPWPHCNPSCPTIRDQFTGQEMNVAQFLMHMGFDVQTVAQQQGMEPSKLLGMLSNGN